MLFAVLAFHSPGKPEKSYYGVIHGCATLLCADNLQKKISTGIFWATIYIRKMRFVFSPILVVKDVSCLIFNDLITICACRKL